MWAPLRRILNRSSSGETRSAVTENSSRNTSGRHRRHLAGNRNQRRYLGSCRVPSYPMIPPSQVRTRRFPTTRRGGLDPTEVGHFLHRVADDLTAAYAQLAVVREENARIKSALRQWQSAQAPTAYELARR